MISQKKNIEIETKTVSEAMFKKIIINKKSSELTTLARTDRIFLSTFYPQKI